ncbi:MAG: hypothetical protein PHN75_19400 [Syntrophales bacterium]|nr:hypothetical protein [Syntrophales bacterium]
MRTVRFSISGDNSLSDITDIIAFQESKDSEFLDSKISYEDQAVVNLVTFNLYDDTFEPKKIILQKKDLAPPGSEKPFWEGVMAVEKGLLVITAYRAD